jgi:hypothetical protein
VFLLSVAVAGSTGPTPKFITLDRLCGVLEFVTPVDGDRKDTQALSDVGMELYPWEEGIACCKNSHPFFKTVTGKDGAFGFKNVDAGRYWLVVRNGKKPLRVAIAFDPRNRTPASAACSQQLLEIDSHGTFQLGIYAEM